VTPAGTTPAVTRPEHCVMGFGIPITVRAFRDSPSGTGGPRRRFAERYNGLLAPYLNDVIAPCRHFTSRVARLGVGVVADLTLAGYSALFRGEGVQAVILFSHFEDDAIELSDGFADAAALVQATPDDFAGCLDLCVCHPRRLIPTLRQCRPRCDIRWVDEEMTPALWLFFYRRLFYRLHHKPAGYPEAQVELLIRLLASGGPAGERQS
jgi:hypothetical protein